MGMKQRLLTALVVAVIAGGTGLGIAVWQKSEFTVAIAVISAILGLVFGLVFKFRVV